MGLLDGLLSVNVADCTGRVTGSVSVLSGLLQVTIGDVLYVKVGSVFQPANCGTGGTGGTGGGTTTPTLPLSSVTPANPAAASGSLALLTLNPTTVRRTGTCGVCVRQRIPLNGYGLVVVHPKRRAPSGNCLGSLTIPREDRTVKVRS